MLDLKARIHLKEIEFTRLIKQKLNRSRTHIINSLGRLDRCLPHGHSQLGRHDRTRRFFHHLLMAALNRTITLSKVNRITQLIGEHLDLNMPWTHHRLFNDQLAGSKGIVRFRLCQLDR